VDFTFLLVVFFTSSCSAGLNTDLCELEPIVVPTLVAIIPDEFELDETTNPHKSGNLQVIDLESY